MKKLFFYLIVSSLLISLFAIENTAEKENNELSINVEISEIAAAEKGQLIVRIFYNETSWNDNLPAQEIKIEELSPTLTFSVQLPEEINSLAIQIVHDANINGKLDFRIFPFPKPTEGIGLSNNYFRKGRPRFSDAEISIENISEQIPIEMNYF